ncbi:hypothetical protein PFISCL1PPCAC_7047, partial [Pristionchus fissidentatus]
DFLVSTIPSFFLFRSYFLSMIGVKSTEELSKENTQLRKELAKRGVELAEKQNELETTIKSLQTVIALKNQKIKDLQRKVDAMIAENHFKVNKENGNKEFEKILNLQKELVMKDVEIQKLKKESVSIPLAISAKNEPTQSTLRAKFKNISKLTGANSVSKVAMAGREWCIQIRMKMDGTEKFLDAFLEVETPFPPSWSCNAFFTIMLLRHKSEKTPYSKTVKNVVFNAKDYVWGLNKYISYEDLLLADNHFVQDDSIIIEIDAKVYPTE